MSSEAGSREPAILLNNLSKKYPVYDRPSQKLLELLTLRRKQFHREFWALRNIDLSIEKGTTLGIIGQNGSGKSTLLQIVAAILQPTLGFCRVQGKVAALLELGAGFNPEFTGRENVFMNGAILGIRHSEIERRFDDIANFAEIGTFIDQPVKTYSSGMFMRLAFSVAIHVDPDILLVDESLAVGDLIFQHRCINRIRRLRAQGKTILLVTHDLQAITQFCDRALLLDKGLKLAEGNPEDVVNHYRALIFERERGGSVRSESQLAKEQDPLLPVVETVPHIHHRYGAGGAEVIGILLHTPEGEVVHQAEPGQALQLTISVRFKKPVAEPIIGFTVRDRMGTEISASNTSYEEIQLPSARPGEIITAGFCFSLPSIRPGSYSISPAIAQGSVWEHSVEDWIDNAYIFDIVTEDLVYGMMRWEVQASYRKVRAMEEEVEGSSRN